jgi:hypothetical protein
VQTKLGLLGYSASGLDLWGSSFSIEAPAYLQVSPRKSGVQGYSSLGFKVAAITPAFNRGYYGFWLSSCGLGAYAWGRPVVNG